MAYTTGGRPDPSTAEVRAFFEHELPGFMIAMARGEDGQESARRVLASARSAQLPDAVVGALQGYTGAYVAALGSDEARPSAPSAAERAEAGAPVLAGSPDAAGSPDTPDTPGSTQAAAVQAASAALNRSLASAQLGYYVDSQVTRHREHGLRVYLETFEVNQVAHYRLGPHVERALTIKRLDHSNIALSTLGFTRPEATEGLVQIDRIEEHLLAHVLPALQPDGVFRYAPASATRTPAMTQLEELASASIRGELLALVPAEAGMALAGAIHTRRALFERWQEAARRQDAVFRLPTTYEIDMESLEPYRWQLEGFSELRRVHRVLGEDATVHAYITLRDALVRSVTRHELQHRYDYREGIFDQVPAGLAEALLHQPAGEPLEGVSRATVAELSAYCAAVAEGGDVTKTELTLLSRHLLGVGMGRPAEARAAFFLLEQLDALLFPDGPIIGRRPIHSATRVQRILGRDAAEIRAGARQLWERWFGRPLPRWEPSATPPP